MKLLTFIRGASLAGALTITHAAVAFGAASHATTTSTTSTVESAKALAQSTGENTPLHLSGSTAASHAATSSSVTVGSYLLSVQDDLGYVKLVRRFIGAPLVLRTGSRTVPVEGVLAPGPASIPDLGPVSYRHTAYEAFSFGASAFPSGPLRISLLLPIAHSLSAETCAEIKSRELGRVAQRISRRFPLAPGNFSAYITVTRGLTDALIYIRSGSRQLAGSTRPGPPRLPSAGSVVYRGASYEVSSFPASTAVGQVRIYELVTP